MQRVDCSERVIGQCSSRLLQCFTFASVHFRAEGVEETEERERRKHGTKEDLKEHQTREKVREQ